MNDLRFAFRQLLKNPGFTAVAVLTLALGVGVNSALFSVLYAVLLAPLPYPEPARLVQVQSTISTPGKPPETFPTWSYPRFELLRDHNRIFAQIAAFDSRTLIVTGGDSAERVEAIPGVESVCLANAAPLSGTFDRSFMVVLPAGKDGGRVEAFIGVHLTSREYLHTLRVPLVRGRWFTDQDRKGAQLVVVINETAARKYWPGMDPVGQYVDLSPALSSDFSRVEVVGVIGDVKYDQMAAEMGPNVYLSYLQSGYPGYYVNLRTAGDPLAVTDAVRTAVAAMSSEVPVYDLMTMEQRMANSISRTEFNALLLIAFGVLAMVLAAVGLYGVVAYSVTQRTREIGIRMALGARAADVLGLIVRQGMHLVLAGSLVGLIGALALTRLMRGLLFGVSATDPLTFVVIPVLLAGVALLACYLPARRAAKVDPMVALRCE